MQSSALLAIISIIFSLVFFVGILALVVICIVGVWKVYAKAGKPGWAVLVPFYSEWVMARIGGKPGWWMFLLMIPLVNLIISLLICLGVAERFGKSGAFGVFGLWLFGFIGFPVLGLGEAVYDPRAAGKN